MVVNLSILKNNGFVKGAFIASVVLAANGNGVCYGMKEGTLDIISKKDNTDLLNEDKLNKIKKGRFIIAATDFCSSVLHSLVTGYFLGHNAFPDHLGWYAELKSLSVGYKKNFLSFLSFNFEISVFRFLTTSIIENFVELCAMDKNRIKNYLLFDPDLGKKNPYWQYYGYYIFFIFIHGFTVERGVENNNYCISKKGQQNHFLFVKTIMTNYDLLLCKLLNFININFNIYFKTNLYITLNILPLALIPFYLLTEDIADAYFAWEETGNFGCAKNLVYYNQEKNNWEKVGEDDIMYNKRTDGAEGNSHRENN